MFCVRIKVQYFIVKRIQCSMPIDIVIGSPKGRLSTTQGTIYCITLWCQPGV